MVAHYTIGALARAAEVPTSTVRYYERAGLLPGFAEAKAAALQAGALGSSISGSGPTAFALARGRESAERVARAMADAYRARGESSTVRVGPVDREGATVTREGLAT